MWKQKCVLNTVAFLVESFRFSNFQYSEKMRIFNFSYNRFRNVFGLITHIIKLFQTVQIQKGSFGQSKCHLKYEKSKWCKTSFEEYIFNISFNSYN